VKALDPEEAGFADTDPLVRVDRADALFVDAIHTDTKKPGGNSLKALISTRHQRLFTNTLQKIGKIP
jgi:hypothetical protein